MEETFFFFVWAKISLINTDVTFFLVIVDCKTYATIKQVVKILFFQFLLSQRSSVAHIHEKSVPFRQMFKQKLIEFVLLYFGCDCLCGRMWWNCSENICKLCRHYVISANIENRTSKISYYHGISLANFSERQKQNENSTIHYMKSKNNCKNKIALLAHLTMNSQSN